MKTGLVIVSKDRPQYVERCVGSLKAADLSEVKVKWVDTSASFANQITNETVCAEHGWHYERIYRADIKQCLLTGFDWLIAQGCDFLINLDSDAIITPDFVRRLEVLHELLPLKIVSGFNNGRDFVLQEHEFTVKTTANGINMGFGISTYERLIKPALISNASDWDYAATMNIDCVFTRPSCVQHIGYKSSMGHDGDVDLAIDFPPTLHLPDVTLFGIDSHDPDGLRHAAKESQRDIAFGSYRIITDDLFTPNGTREQRRVDYSRFCIKELGNQFHTSHVLIIHADGWVVNPLAWRDEWLQYDYIGAPWWFHNDEYRVGNGGFSLRSKKLCDYLAQADIEYIHPEDHHICRTYRASLEAVGFKFAPEEVAAQFSVEGQPYSQQFGFHGKQVDFTGADIARVPFRSEQMIDPLKAAEEARRKRSDRWRK